jgi:hypothetical protein
MENRQHFPATSNLDSRIDSEEIETIRRHRSIELNSRAAGRPELEAEHGQVWAPGELSHDFEVIGFAAPYVVVRSKRDGKLGSLEFQHHPRFYFNFEPDQPA